MVLGGTKLAHVKITKFLGITINENFTRKCQIDNITKTMSCNIGVMNKVKHFVSERNCIFCIVLWNSLNDNIVCV